MGFQITDFDQNQCIQTKYSIQTPLWITLSWMTLITQVKENSYFIDEQIWALQFLAPQAFFWSNTYWN
jgi:hypothetical protein